MKINIGNFPENPNEDRVVEIHIDNFDTWNMDGTLAMIILPMLKQLNEHKHGAPGTMPAFEQVSGNNGQRVFDFYEAENDYAWEQGHAQWQVIMDKMIWAFEQIQPDYDWEEQYTIVEGELDWDVYPEDEEKDAIPMRWKKEYVIDWEGRAQHAARIQEGLELFGKYYQNLWD